MMRKLLLLAASLAAAVPSLAFADTMLLPNVTVTGDTIHISDIFRDAGPHASDPVAAAPAPGTRVTYNAAWLGSIAREHHLAWQPSSEFDQTSVERASRTIDANTVGQRILAAAATTAGSAPSALVPFALIAVIIVVALVFDFLNGFHDAANSIATVVSTRVLSPTQAVIWAAFFNFIAAFLFGTKVADTIGAGDAFTAALTHYLLRGADLATLNEAGNRWGAWMASQQGAMPLLPETVLARVTDAIEARLA